MPKKVFLEVKMPLSLGWMQYLVIFPEMDQPEQVLKQHQSQHPELEFRLTVPFGALA